MTAPRDTDRSISAFLADGPAELSPRLAEAIRHDVHPRHVLDTGGLRDPVPAARPDDRGGRPCAGSTPTERTTGWRPATSPGTAAKPACGRCPDLRPPPWPNWPL